MRMIGRLEKHRNNGEEEFRILYCDGICEPICLLFTAQCGRDERSFAVYTKDDCQQVYAAELCADRLLEIEDPERWADIELMLDELEAVRTDLNAQGFSAPYEEEVFERQWNNAVSQALMAREIKKKRGDQDGI